MRSVPRLGWLNGKTFQNSGNSRKNRSGLKPEHTAALVENGLGKLAQKEFDTRLGIVDVKTEGDISLQPETKDLLLLRRRGRLVSVRREE